MVIHNKYIKKLYYIMLKLYLMRQVWTFHLGSDTVKIVNHYFKEQIFFNGEILEQKVSYIPKFSSKLNTTLTTADGQKKQLAVYLKAGFINVNCKASLDGEVVDLQTTSEKLTFKAFLSFVIFIIIGALIGGAIGYSIVKIF